MAESVIQALVLENRHLEVTVLPGLGGKVLSIVDKATNLELLWANPRLPLVPVVFGSDYDDAFVGGWDEVYPNDEPEEVAGQLRPDHGEVWSLPWDFSLGSDADHTWVELRVETPVTKSVITKLLTLGSDAWGLRVDYRLHNAGSLEQPFLWKSHVAVALHDDSRLDLGAETMFLHDFGNPRGGGRSHFTWPKQVIGGNTWDMRTLPAADSGMSELMESTRMETGTCAVSHPSLGVGLRLDFDLADLPECWTFASYGGWQNLHVLVLEPATRGVLKPGEVRRWSLTATVERGSSGGNTPVSW